MHHCNLQPTSRQSCGMVLIELPGKNFALCQYDVVLLLDTPVTAHSSQTVCHKSASGVRPVSSSGQCRQVGTRCLIVAESVATGLMHSP